MLIAKAVEGKAMSIEQKSKCVGCGAEFIYSSAKRGRSRIYCGIKCRNRAYERDAVTLICKNCGREFTRYGQLPRICCGTACAVEAVRRETSERRTGGFCGKLRDWALELCLRGYGAKAVSVALGINHVTVKSWLERTKGKKDTRKSGRRFSFQATKTAEEWLSELRTQTVAPMEYAQNVFATRQIYLVCGGTNAKLGADTLSSIIQAHLGNNARDGSVYVFCNDECKIIRCLFWDGDGFSMIDRHRERGRYLWPSSKVGTTIKVTPQDIERILRCKRENENPSLTWDDIDFSS